MDDSKGNKVLFRGSQLKIENGTVIAQENTTIPINEALRRTVGSKSFSSVRDAIKGLKKDLDLLSKRGF